MAEPTGFGKVLSDITQAYVDGLSKIGGAISDLAKRRIPDAERQMEHWIGVARTTKDGYVAAIDQAFAMWEKRIRQTLAPSDKESKSGDKSQPSQLEALLEQWRAANETFMQSIRDSGLGEEALKQTRELRKAFDEGLKNLQKLWTSSSKTDRK